MILFRWLLGAACPRARLSAPDDIVSRRYTHYGQPGQLLHALPRQQQRHRSSRVTWAAKYDSFYHFWYALFYAITPIIATLAGYHFPT